MRLRKDLARSIKRGHPWVYRDALARPPELPNGSLVDVLGKDGRWVATGFWDRASPIAVRVLTTSRGLDAVRVVEERLATAARARLGRLDRTRTNAFRWVHGEADGLPGVHVDVYGEAATVRFDGVGARAFYADFAALLQSEPSVGVRRPTAAPCGVQPFTVVPQIAVSLAAASVRLRNCW